MLTSLDKHDARKQKTMVRMIDEETTGNSSQQEIEEDEKKKTTKQHTQNNENGDKKLLGWLGGILYLVTHPRFAFKHD